MSTYLARGLPVATGIAAKLACSGVFVSGRSLEDVTRNDIARLSPLTRHISYELDSPQATVTTNMFGFAARSALYRPGVGCTLMNDVDRATLLRQAEGIEAPPVVHRPQPWPAGDLVDLNALPVGIDAPTLRRAVAAAFEEEMPESEIDTRAIVVVHDGRIVAERYAPGFNADMRLLGWSASKSVMGALVGTLVVDGRMAVTDTVSVSQWQDADPRRKITLEQLLRMTSGLAFTEPYEPGSDSTTMLFTRGDMAGYAATRELQHPPGTVYRYSSGTSNLLSGIVLRTVGGTLAAYHDYAWRRFLEPAGMRSFVLEPDATGAFVGSSYAYATARDWARFGLLHLNEGELNGRRILSPEWVRYAREPASANRKRHFGAHFALNLRPGQQGTAQRQYPNLPEDTYLAFGYNTQVIAIIPSRNAVIVRLGWTTGAAEFDTDKHFAAILQALPPPGS